MNEFRCKVRNSLKFNWQFGLTLILLFGVPRFIIVLDANRSGNYNLTSIMFLLMIITPYIFLTKKGRKMIGIKRPTNHIWLMYSFLLGIVSCIIVFFIGFWLYESSVSNWFIYISNSYSIPVGELEGINRHIYFVIFALIGMTFSPIGEELLYRGLIHQSFVSKFGNDHASIIDSIAFAITHLAHFGIIYVAGSWQILFIPSLLWMIFMFLTSRVFFFCKTNTGSVYGAILSHSGFNMAMTYFIFYHIL